MGTLRFTNYRNPKSFGELDERTIPQVTAFSRVLDGKDVPLAGRFVRSEWMHGSRGELLFANHLELWDVEEAGELRYQAVLLVDSGSVYRAGTLDEVASQIQAYFESERPGLAEELTAAYAEALRERAAAAPVKKATRKRAKKRGAKKPAAPAKKVVAKKTSAASRASKKTATKNATDKRAADKRATPGQATTKKASAKKATTRKRATGINRIVVTDGKINAK